MLAAAKICCEPSDRGSKRAKEAVRTAHTSDRSAFDVFCRAPNRWQGWSARKRDAGYIVEKLRGVLSRIPVDYPDAISTTMKAMGKPTRPA
jgi:hypothetical protein